MVSVLLRRFRDLVIVLLVVGSMLFFAVRLIPGDPAVALLGDAATPERLAQLREQLGLTGPLGAQYLTWLGHVVRGDLGQSLTYQAPVLEVLLSRLGPTLILVFSSIVISFVLAVLITSWHAARPNSTVARWITNAAALGMSVPGFWIGLILIWIFAVQLRWLPPSGYVPITEDPLAALSLLALPVATLCLNQTAQFTLILRESLLGEMPLLYLRTARSKGLPERTVVMRHVLPNAMLPIITVLGLDFAILIGAAAVIEIVFVIPGMGSTMLAAIATRDYALIQGGVLLVAFLFVLINLLVDIAYVLLDPKVRVS